MKRIIFILCAVVVSFSTATGQGIVFETGTVAEALSKARIEGKLLFVDIYTDWCGPCKKMTADVFKRESVGSLFNENFVNYKIDAEKGEGPEFAKKYGVTAYPTMLFLNSDGSVVHRILGACNEGKFLGEANIVSKSAGFGGLERMKQEFSDGNNDPEFLKNFYSLFPEKDKLRPQIALRLLKALPDSELFSQRSDEHAMFLSDLIGALDAFDHDLFYRFVDGFTTMHGSEDNKIGRGAYHMSVVFGLEMKTKELMQAAIDNAEHDNMEELIRYREYWPVNTFTRTMDGDHNISSGRGIVFASPEFNRLTYIAVNRSDADKFLTTVSPYMEELMSELPLDSLLVDDPRAAVLADNGALAGILGVNLYRERDITMRNIMLWTDYFWKLSPSDKKTKEIVAKWINYAAALNRFHPEMVLDSTPLLLRIGRKKDAVANLEAVIENYALIAPIMERTFKERRLELLRRMLSDVQNDKAY